MTEKDLMIQDLQEENRKLKEELNAPVKTIKTNADLIRNMSDEELAMNMMCPNENGLAEIACDKNDSCNCYECVLKWLRSETEG